MEDPKTVWPEIKACIEAALYAGKMATEAGFDANFVANLAQLAFHGQYAMYEKTESASMAALLSAAKRNA